MSLGLKNLIEKLILNKTNVELHNYEECIDNVIFILKFNKCMIKITTDFINYCLAETIDKNININDFNMKIVFENKDPKTILDKVIKLFNCENEELQVEIKDPFHILQKFHKFTKTSIDYVALQKEFNKINQKNKYTKSIINKIPKGLLLSPLQISQLIINEIEQVNCSKDYLHYIDVNQSDPYTLILRIKFDIDTNTGKLFNQIKKDYGYDYVELNIILDSTAYPYIPPKLEYIKPKIKLPLLIGIMNLDILKLENWNPTITLDYLISKLGIELENIISDYIILDEPSKII